MKWKWKQIERALGLTMAGICLFLICSCASAPTAETTTEPESASSSETETQTQAPEQGQVQVVPKGRSDVEAGIDTGLGIDYGIGNDKAKIQHVEGVDVIDSRVERVGGSMVYTPDAGAGYFTINGTIAEDSEIAISIHPISVLRYKLSLNANAEKTVKAEIRMYKKGEMLVSCEQKEMTLQEGTNDVDVCIDTGEDAACSGTYVLRFYLDDCLVSENEYDA